VTGQAGLAWLVVAMRHGHWHHTGTRHGTAAYQRRARRARRARGARRRAPRGRDGLQQTPPPAPPFVIMQPRIYGISIGSSPYPYQ
jgi:hypothetical protein